MYIEKFENLVNWIKENGGEVDDDIFIDLVDEGNRTLKVSDNKYPNNLLIKVPKKCTIRCENEINRETKYIISLKLLKEFNKGKESFYFPYLDILPTNDELYSHPIYKYNEADIEEIKEISDAVYNTLTAYNNDINKFYDNYIKENEELRDEYKTLSWARYIITLYHSRSWNVLGFIPLLDMIQHSTDPQEMSSVLSQEDGSLGFVNRKKLGKGGEMSHCYSLFSKINLYLNYGIDVNFEINYVPFTLTMNPENKLYDYKIACLKANNLYSGNNNLSFLCNESPFLPRVLIMMRILQLTEFDLKMLRVFKNMKDEEQLEPLVFENNILSIENEYNSVKFLINYLENNKLQVKSRNMKYKNLINILDNINEILDNKIENLKNYWKSLL